MATNDDILRSLPPDFQDRIAKMPEAKRAETLERARKRFESMDDNARAQMLEAQRESQDREKRVPQAGSIAPDFDLPVLDGDGQRVRLSALRGRPVGLIFGSYT